jgi:ubiquinone/menaquinone biosynthesis C-methylase UbiE
MANEQLERSVGVYVASFTASRYLVVGASPHLLTTELIGCSKTVTMIDIRRDRLDKAARRFERVECVLVEEGDEFSSFDDRSFDCVVFYDVLHHFPHKKKAIAETRRILREQGSAFFSEPNISSKLRREYDQFGVLKDSIYKGSFISILSENSFDVDVHTYSEFVAEARSEMAMRRRLRNALQRFGADPLFRIYLTAKSNGIRP